MRKLFIALVAAVTIAGTVLAVPGEAEARWRGGAVAAGVLGGLAAGAIIAGAAAPYYYAPPPRRSTMLRLRSITARPAAG